MARGDSGIRLAVVASSGGSVFAELVRLSEGLPVSFEVVTDRPCGIEAVADRHAIPHRRIVEQGNRAFSGKAAETLASADACLLFFARLVTGELYDRVPTLNVHPSLLPAFPGFHAIRRARLAEQRILGATLHRATAATDAGPVVAQIATAADPTWPEQRWNKISFLQKVYLSLVLVELLLGAGIPTGAASLLQREGTTHALTDPALARRFEELQRREGEAALR